MYSEFVGSKTTGDSVEMFVFVTRPNLVPLNPLILNGRLSFSFGRVCVELKAGVVGMLCDTNRSFEESSSFVEVGNGSDWDLPSTTSMTSESSVTGVNQTSVPSVESSQTKEFVLSIGANE